MIHTVVECRWFSDLDSVDVIVDVGRLSGDSPVLDILRCADLTLMLARPCIEQLQPAAPRMRSMSVDTSRIGWLLIGERPYSASEVVDAFGLDILGIIADDVRGAAALEQGASGHGLRRSGFARSAGTVAATLAARLHPMPDDGGLNGDPLAGAATPLAAMEGASHDC